MTPFYHHDDHVTNPTHDDRPLVVPENIYIYIYLFIYFDTHALSVLFDMTIRLNEFVSKCQRR